MEISGLYIYVDGSDLEEVSEPIEQSIDNWLKSKGISAKVVNTQHKRTPDLSPEDHADWDLGLNISANQTECLPSLLDHLYDLAIEYNRDFVVGYYSESSGVSEDISFFGTESGKPKAAQVTEFLGTNG